MRWNNIENKNIITKENLIKDIAKQTNNNIGDVRDIYNALEDYLFDILSFVNEEQDISIKLFGGISLDGIFVPAKTKVNNLTGEETLVDSKIKPKFKITRSYRERLNNNKSNE